jgi:acyl carrier protein
MSWDAEYDQILRASLPLLPAGAPLRPDANLTDLGLDSLGTVSLLIEIEDSFGITIPDEFLTPDTFATGDALWNVVGRLRLTLPDQDSGD